MEKKHNNSKKDKPLDEYQIDSLVGDESLNNVPFVPGENGYLNDTGEEE